eukprot:11218636-Lingulodinium_polyedra.AAC.1
MSWQCNSIRCNGVQSSTVPSLASVLANSARSAASTLAPLPLMASRSSPRDPSGCSRTFALNFD